MIGEADAGDAFMKQTKVCYNGIARRQSLRVEVYAKARFTLLVAPTPLLLNCCSCEERGRTMEENGRDELMTCSDWIVESWIVDNQTDQSKSKGKSRVIIQSPLGGLRKKSRVIGKSKVIQYSSCAKRKYGV